MSQRSAGLFSQIVQNIRRSWKVKRHGDLTAKVYIGSDEQGNKYYEQKGSDDKTIKTKRWVETLASDHADIPRLPMQWDAWIRGRRNDPPSEEEEAAISQRLARSKYQMEMENSSKGNQEENIFGKKQERVPFPKYDDLETKPFGRYNPE